MALMSYSNWQYTTEAAVNVARYLRHYTTVNSKARSTLHKSGCTCIIVRDYQTTHVGMKSGCTCTIVRDCQTTQLEGMSQLRSELDSRLTKKLALLLCSPANGVNGVITNHREVGDAFEQTRYF
jgi:hypothetical protein